MFKGWFGMLFSSFCLFEDWHLVPAVYIPSTRRRCCRKFFQTIIQVSPFLILPFGEFGSGWNRNNFRLSTITACIKWTSEFFCFPGVLHEISG